MDNSFGLTLLFPQLWFSSPARGNSNIRRRQDGLAQFPDAVTERGTRHARHLAELARQGQRTMILFVIQREDADRFRPMWDRDPALGHALVAARKAGVAIHAIRTAVSPEAFAYRGEVPIDLSPPDG